MTGETVREFLHAAPFTPFTIYMTDGKAFNVKHPDFATLSEGGQTIVINLEGERFAWVDLRLATRIEGVQPNQPA